VDEFQDESNASGTRNVVRITSLTQPSTRDVISHSQIKGVDPLDIVLELKPGVLLNPIGSANETRNVAREKRSAVHLRAARWVLALGDQEQRNCSRKRSMVMMVRDGWSSNSR